MVQSECMDVIQERSVSVSFGSSPCLPTLCSHPTLQYKCTHCFSVHVCTSRGEVNTMCCDTLFNCTNVLTAMHKLCHKLCFAVPCVLFTMVWLGRIRCSSATLAFFGHQGKCGQNGGHSHHCNYPHPQPSS